jgi:hypothetical protein
MARPLRLEYASALYHVTSGGDRREDIVSSNWIQGAELVKGIGDKCASFASTFNPVDSAVACRALPVQSADPTPLRLAR